jgi:DNA-binding transcriptional ArsR family regulator
MQADSLSLTFSALGDPTRRAILARLSEGEASVGELTEPFDISMPAISRHLKVLERRQLGGKVSPALARRFRSHG